MGDEQGPDEGLQYTAFAPFDEVLLGTITLLCRSRDAIVAGRLGEAAELMQRANQNTYAMAHQFLRDAVAKDDPPPFVERMRSEEKPKPPADPSAN